MMGQNCLYCYHPIDVADLDTVSAQKGYHEKCSRKFFGSANPPDLDISDEQIRQLASQIIQSQKAVTGVQPKLSLGFKDGVSTEKLTIVGLYGEYILKPQVSFYKNLPEIEDVTMHLAASAKIKTVEHSLIKLQSNHLAYITKRIDRKGKSKIHMEDMCQLTERLTEQKYRGSYEQIAKVILKYAANPILDVTDFYELVLFSFLTGNNDMHLKNFSLIKLKGGYSLSPAYDLVAAVLVVEDDNEELALNLNGKKRKIKKRDFEIAMSSAFMDAKVIENIFEKYAKLLSKWSHIIDSSFLPKDMKSAYKNMIEAKFMQIYN